MVDPRWAPLLVGDGDVGPVVSRVHVAETRMWSAAPFSARTLRSVMGLRAALRAGRYDVVVDMQGTLRSAVLGRFAAAGRFGEFGGFAGFSDPREAPARWLYRQRLPRRGSHVVTQGAALLGEACGVALEPMVAALPRDAAAERWAEALVRGERVCVLAASAGWEAKQWPAARFGALARELRGRGFRVLTNAVRADDPVAAAVVAASDGAAEVVVCAVAGLVALLRRTALAVGGDTGPVHLAAMLGVPVVAVFGPTDPVRNGPWGDGVVRVVRRAESVTSYRHVAGADAGLERMGVGEVLGAVEAVLGG